MAAKGKEELEREARQVRARGLLLWVAASVGVERELGFELRGVDRSGGVGSGGVRLWLRGSGGLGGP